MQKQLYLDKKLAFYSCFYGNNNNYSFKIPPLPSLKYDCYFYTNNKTLMKMLRNTPWLSIYCNKETSDDIIKSCMVGKHIKVLPYEYPILAKYDYLCYLDSKLGKVNELFVECFIKKYFINSNYALLLRKHEFIKPNIWNEYDVSMKQERYLIHSETYKKYINTQLENGLNENVETHAQCGFLIRNMKHPKMKEIDETWFKHIQECGIQDQISFFFVKQLFTDVIHPFSENPFLLTRRQ
jgi:hypothetical protein